MSSAKEISFPDDLKYAATHEWVKIDGDTAIVGITDYAQDALGDIVYVELPEPGMELRAGRCLASSNRSKRRAMYLCPSAARFPRRTAALTDSPETVNTDAVRCRVDDKSISRTTRTDLAKLMDAATYKSKIESGEIH